MARTTFKGVAVGDELTDEELDVKEEQYGPDTAPEPEVPKTEDILLEKTDEGELTQPYKPPRPPKVETDITAGEIYESVFSPETEEIAADWLHNFLLDRGYMPDTLEYEQAYNYLQRQGVTSGWYKQQLLGTAASIAAGMDADGMMQSFSFYLPNFKRLEHDYHYEMTEGFWEGDVRRGWRLTGIDDETFPVPFSLDTRFLMSNGIESGDTIVVSWDDLSAFDVDFTQFGVSKGSSVRFSRGGQLISVIKPNGWEYYPTGVVGTPRESKGAKLSPHGTIFPSYESQFKRELGLLLETGDYEKGEGDTYLLTEEDLESLGIAVDIREMMGEEMILPPNEKVRITGDGSIISIISSDGTEYFADGTTKNPDGTIVDAEGNVIYDEEAHKEQEEEAKERMKTPVKELMGPDAWDELPNFIKSNEDMTLEEYLEMFSVSNEFLLSIRPEGSGWYDYEWLTVMRNILSMPSDERMEHAYGSIHDFSGQAELFPVDMRVALEALGVSEKDIQELQTKLAEVQDNVDSLYDSLYDAPEVIGRQLMLQMGIPQEDINSFYATKREIQKQKEAMEQYEQIKDYVIRQPNPDEIEINEETGEPSPVIGSPFMAQEYSMEQNPLATSYMADVDKMMMDAWMEPYKDQIDEVSGGFFHQIHAASVRGIHNIYTSLRAYPHITQLNTDTGMTGTFSMVEEDYSQYGELNVPDTDTIMEDYKEQYADFFDPERRKQEALDALKNIAKDHFEFYENHPEYIKPDWLANERIIDRSNPLWAGKIPINRDVLNPSYIIYNAFEQLPFMAWVTGSMIAGNVLGGTIGAQMLGTVSAMPITTNEIFQSTMQAGATPEEAARYASLYGIPSAAVETFLNLPMLRAFAPMKGAWARGATKAIADTFAKTAMRQGTYSMTEIVLAESMEEVIQEVIANVAAVPFDEERQIYDNLGETFGQAFLTMLPMAMFGGGSAYLRNSWQYEKISEIENIMKPITEVPVNKVFPADMAKIKVFGRKMSPRQAWRAIYKDLRYKKDENGEFLKDEDGNLIPRKELTEQQAKALTWYKLGRYDTTATAIERYVMPQYQKVLERMPAMEVWDRIVLDNVQSSRGRRILAKIRTGEMLTEIDRKFLKDRKLESMEIDGVPISEWLKDIKKAEEEYTTKENLPINPRSIIDFIELWGDFRDAHKENLKDLRNKQAIGSKSLTEIGESMGLKGFELDNFIKHGLSEKADPVLAYQIAFNETMRQYGLSWEQMESMLDWILLRKDKDIFDRRNVANIWRNKIMRGKVLTKKEQVRIADFIFEEHPKYKEAFMQTMDRHRGLGEKAQEVVADILNIPRTIMASWDLSAPLRQGFLLFFFERDITIQALKEMVNVARSKDFKTYADGIMNEIQADEELWAEMNEKYTDEVETLIVDPFGTIEQREEIAMSDIAMRIWGVERSQVAFTVYLNVVRWQMFKKMMGEFNQHDRAINDEMKRIEQEYKKYKTVYGEKASYKELQDTLKRLRKQKTSDEDIIELRKVLNIMTGRGSLRLGGINFEQFAPTLNAVFFAPKLQFARIEVLPRLFYNVVRGQLHNNANARIISRMMAYNIGTSLFMAASGIMFMAMLYDEDIELDPRSSDFMKLRLGDMRLDPWAGFQQYVRLLAQLVTLEKKRTSTGAVLSESPKDILMQAMRSKASPIMAVMFDIITGRSFTGDEIEATPDTVADIIVGWAPLVLRDLAEMVEKGEFGKLPFGMSAFMGVGLQTYNARWWDRAHENLGDPLDPAQPYLEVTDYYSTKDLRTEVYSKAFEGVDVDEVDPKYGILPIEINYMEARDIHERLLEEVTDVNLLREDLNLKKALADGEITKDQYNKVKEYRECTSEECRNRVLDKYPELKMSWLDRAREVVKENPEMNAKLFLWGYDEGKQLYTKEAYDLVRKYMQEFNIPESGIPSENEYIPSQYSEDYYKYIELVNEGHDYTDAEMKLFLYDKPYLWEYLGSEGYKESTIRSDPKEVLKIKANPDYKTKLEEYNTLKEQYEGLDEEWDEVEKAFFTENEKFLDKYVTLQEYDKLYGWYNNTDLKAHDYEMFEKWVEARKKMKLHGSSSLEAKQYLAHNKDVLQWANDYQVGKDGSTMWSLYAVEDLKPRQYYDLLVEHKEQYEEFTEIKGEGREETAQLKDEFLLDPENKEFAKDYFKAQAYAELIGGRPEDKKLDEKYVDSYADYKYRELQGWRTDPFWETELGKQRIEVGDSAWEDDWYWMEHRDLYEELDRIGALGEYDYISDKVLPPDLFDVYIEYWSAPRYSSKRKRIRATNPRFDMWYRRYYYGEEV